MIHEEYQQAMSRCEQRLEDLRRARDLACAAKKSLSTDKQIEWATQMIDLSEQHLEYLRGQLASVQTAEKAFDAAPE